MPCNRICFFAHYDKDNIIDDYVIYYLERLKQVTDTIIFTSDSELNSAELEKIQNIVTIAHIGHHGEYDFGSWKRCWQYIDNSQHNSKNNLNLNNYEQLILANDSCFGPFHPLAPIFTEMEQKELDVWGFSKGKIDNIERLQSYFMVIRNNIFIQDWFKEFFLNITKQNDYDEIIYKYEHGLGVLLAKHGCKYDSFLELDKKDNLHSYILQEQAFDYINNNQMPLLKCKLLKQNPLNVTHLGQKLQKIYHQSYPQKLYHNYITRICGTKEPIHYRLPITTFRITVINRHFIYLIGKYKKRYKWYWIYIKLFGVMVFSLPIPIFVK